MDYSYIGSGRIYLKKIGSTGGFIEVGNCDGVNINTTEQEITKPDRTQPGGGTYNEVRRIESCALQITAAELSPENLARALYGATSEYTGAAITGELLTVGPGQYTPFAHLHAASPAPALTKPAATRTGTFTRDPGATGNYTSSAVTVADGTALGTYTAEFTSATAYTLRSPSDAVVGSGTTGTPFSAGGFGFTITAGGTAAEAGDIFTIAVAVGAGSPVALVEGTDYELRPGGIVVLEGRAADGDVWTAGYTSVDADVVQALVTSGEEYEVMFDGLNEARSGKRTRVHAFRYKPGVAQAVGLLSDEYAALDVTGKLLKDTTKTGAGISQYFKATIER